MPVEHFQNLLLLSLYIKFVYLKPLKTIHQLLFQTHPPIHEQQKIYDQKQRGLLADAGHDAIVWRYDESLDEMVDNRRDIFRKVFDND